MTSSPIQFDTKSPDETDRLAATLAPLLRPGDVIALAGNLGAGKTHFTRALASALGNSPDSVSSPTFVLLHQYLDGHLPIYHFDTYRLGDLDEFLMLGRRRTDGGRRRDRDRVGRPSHRRAAGESHSHSDRAYWGVSKAVSHGT